MCSAAEDQVILTQDEFNRYQTNLNRFDRILTVLAQSSNQSAKDLLKVEEKLRLSEEKLAKVEAQLLRYENELKQTQDLLKKQDSSLEKANGILLQYEKEMKSKVASLKAEKGLWQAVTAIAVGALIWQAGARH
jgi:septal ring factor EnvC (AmiA/AmiB activator)